MSKPATPFVSVVVPVFDEEQCLPELHARLSAPGLLPPERELLFVDDASRDGSLDVIRRLAAADPAVRALPLAHNGGSQRALLAGLRAARGEVVVTLDADLQHPPEQIPAMLEQWRRGSQLVEMLRVSAPSNGVLRELLTPLFYRAFNAVAASPIDPRSTDFRLLDRACVAALEERPGELLRGAIARLDAPRTTLTFDVPARFAGPSRYSLPRLAATALGALWAARARPARAPLPRVASPRGL